MVSGPWVADFTKNDPSFTSEKRSSCKMTHEKDPNQADNS